MDTATRFTRDDGLPASVREMLLDMIEEYARHTGHADLLREYRRRPGRRERTTGVPVSEP